MAKSERATSGEQLPTPILTSINRWTIIVVGGVLVGVLVGLLIPQPDGRLLPSSELLPLFAVTLAAAISGLLVIAINVDLQRRHAKQRLVALKTRVDESTDAQLREVVADYGSDEIADVFDGSARRTSLTGWAATIIGLVFLGAGGWFGWRVFQITPTAEVSEALARLAVTLPAIYAAGVLVKRGSALLQESQQLWSRTVAIKAIPLIAARFDDSPGLAQSFIPT